MDNHGKVLGLLMASIALSPQARAIDGPEMRQIVKNVVSLYQNESYGRYNARVDLNFVEEDVLNAFAVWQGKNASVNFYKTLLEKLTQDEVIVVVCHELGHVLGDLTEEKAGGESRGDPLSLEGEADWFAGRCAVGYYQDIEGFSLEGAQEKTFQAAVDVFSKIYETEAVAQRAASKKFGGINLSYADPDCRALSVWAGAEGRPRPSCWYDPQ
jgi:hypothetical protein